MPEKKNAIRLSQKEREISYQALNLFSQMESDYIRKSDQKLAEKLMRKFWGKK